jgi:hypothetical protein
MLRLPFAADFRFPVRAKRQKRQLAALMLPWIWWVAPRYGACLGVDAFSSGNAHAEYTTRNVLRMRLEAHANDPRAFGLCVFILVPAGLASAYIPPQ